MCVVSCNWVKRYISTAVENFMHALTQKYNLNYNQIQGVKYI